MCLKIENTFKRRDDARAFTKEPLIAKKSIVVYKILLLVLGKQQELITPYRMVNVAAGKINIAEKFSFSVVDACGWRVNVNKGIHSFKNKKDALMLGQKMKFNEGMTLVVECKIPKGAPYFENQKEYASLALYIPELSMTAMKFKGAFKLSKDWKIVI